jgi:hypothetical protein
MAITRTQSFLSTSLITSENRFFFLEDYHGEGYLNLMSLSPVSYYNLFALNSWAVSTGVGWAVFFVLATPYFSLYEVSPFWTSFAISSGPASGLLQPIFGIVSDVTQSSLGRRRPWLIIGN